MKLTKNKLVWFAQLHELIVEIAEKYGKIKYGYDGGFSINTANSNGFDIDVNWTEGCRGCYQDMHDNFFLPNNILLNPNWEKDLIKEIEKEKELKKLQEQYKQAQEKQQRQITKEIKERAEYERLKAKYET